MEQSREPAREDGAPAPAAPAAVPRRRRLRSVFRWGSRLAAGIAGAGLLGLALLAAWINLVPDRGVDVLLVTIDTQRIDGLGCYGAGPDRTPNLDRVAERGVLFERAVASIPRTTQNLSTLMTGLEPKDHGVRELFDHLPDEAVTLAERLRSRGYRTAAFVGGGPLGRDQNLYQGFDHVHVHAFQDQVRALREVIAAAGWITRNASGPWFTWVHVYDPHFYYAPPWPFWDADDPELPSITALYDKLGTGRGSFGALHYENDLTPGQRRTLGALYRGETRGVDFALGWLFRVVRFFERIDPGRQTLVIVTSDHGEGFGEHDCYYNHGAYLYDEDLLVPLIVSLPGTLPERRRIPHQVRTIDVYPTVLELLGQEPGEDPIAGRSLLSLVRRREEGDRPAFSEGDTNRHPQNPRFYYEDGITGRWRSVRDGRFKLIRIPHPDGDRWELYDLEQDPGETRDLSRDHGLAGERERLQAMLAAWEARPSLLEAAPPDELAPDELDDRLDRLRSLGYVN